MDITSAATALNETQEHTPPYVDLDGMQYVDAWVLLEGDKDGYHPVLVIAQHFTASPQEVRLFARDMIERLRDFLNEHFPKEGE